jgi:short-subunit dehydrogenase
MKSLNKIPHRSFFRLFSSTTQPNQQVVIISGASSGIGEEIALKYAGKHTKLILGARRVEKLNEVAQKCLSNGALSADVIKCDVSQEVDCKNMINEAIKLHGKIDVLVLNAGVGQVISSWNIL